MKRKFEQLAKKHGFSIIFFESKRSDMGVQMFEVQLKGVVGIHCDGYFVGEPLGREKVLQYFEKSLLKHKRDRDAI